jgi:hypothetical protein
VTVFEPGRGALTARLFANAGSGVASSLVFDIAVPVRCMLDMPSDADASIAGPTEVRLDFIRIGIVDWRELPGRTFVFPINPEAGYVDGSVYFDGTHQYADLTRLQFGTLSGSVLSATVTITFNFYPNSMLPNMPETVTVNWAIELAIDPAKLDRVLAEARAALRDG